MTGYNPKHLNGFTLPLPDIRPEVNPLFDGQVFTYPNYSVVMHGDQDKRAPLVIGFNIDQSRFQKVKRSRNWKTDQRAGRENQLNDSYFSSTWTRGHMVRSKTAGFGDNLREAQANTNATYYFTNACMQHGNFNGDEWLGIEDWVKGLREDDDDRITVLMGPIYGDFDRTVRPSGQPLALVPSGFFKIVAYIGRDRQDLEVRAFIQYQDVEALKDGRGRRRYNNQDYQVPTSEIDRLTGLKFADILYEKNPLFIDSGNAPIDIPANNLPEHYEISRPSDVIHSPDQDREVILDDEIGVFVAAALVNPDGRDEGQEWISLINMGEDPVDLAGWQLEDNGHSRLNLDDRFGAEALKLQPGASLVVQDVRPLKLSNKGDVIRLYDEDGSRVDWVNYTKNMVISGRVIQFLQARETLR